MRPFLASTLAALVLAAPVGAQGPLASSTVSYRAVDDVRDPVSARLVRGIESSSSSVRADALHAVVTFAFDNPDADLRPAIPSLLAVVREDPDARLRVMALRALEASADTDAMAALRSEAGEQEDPAVQRLLFLVLVDHYGVDALRGDVGVDALVRSLRDHSRR